MKPDTVKILLKEFVESSVNGSFSDPNPINIVVHDENFLDFIQDIIPNTSSLIVINSNSFPSNINADFLNALQHSQDVYLYIDGDLPVEIFNILKRLKLDRIVDAKNGLKPVQFTLPGSMSIFLLGKRDTLERQYSNLINLGLQCLDLGNY